MNGQVSGKWKLADLYSGILAVIYALLPRETIASQIPGPEGEKKVARSYVPPARKSDLVLGLVNQAVEG